MNLLSIKFFLFLIDISMPLVIHGFEICFISFIFT